MEHFLYSFWYIPFGNRWIEINTTIKMKQDNKNKEQTEEKQQVKRPNFGGTLTLKGIKKTKKK